LLWSPDSRWESGRLKVKGKRLKFLIPCGFASRVCGYLLILACAAWFVVVFF